MKKGFLAFVLTGLLAPFSAQFAVAESVEGLAHVLPRFRAALAQSTHATWTASRKNLDLGTTLTSSGAVVFRPNDSIVWTTLAPFPSTVTMAKTQMIFVDEDETRVKPLEDLPYYKEIRERTDAFIAGDDAAFDRIFTMTACEVKSSGEWRLELEPAVSAMKRLLTHVELSGHADLQKVVMTSGRGEKILIRFVREVPPKEVK